MEWLITLKIICNFFGAVFLNTPILFQHIKLGGKKYSSNLYLITFFLALLSVYLGLKDKCDSSFKQMTDEENTVFAMKWWRLYLQPVDIDSTCILRPEKLVVWNDVIVARECLVMTANGETRWKTISTHFISHTFWITTKFSSGLSEVIKSHAKVWFAILKRMWANHSATNPLSKHPLLVGNILFYIDAVVRGTEKQPAGAAMIMMQCNIFD